MRVALVVVTEARIGWPVIKPVVICEYASLTKQAGELSQWRSQDSSNGGAKVIDARAKNFGATPTSGTTPQIPWQLSSCIGSCLD